MCHTTGVFSFEDDVLYCRPSKETPFSLFLPCFSLFIPLFPHIACLLVVISLRNSWDERERERRHAATLKALRDGLLSPQGALTATMLPHLTGLRGVIAVCTSTGRAPLYSALKEDFIPHLSALASESCRMSTFETIEEFYTHMNALIETTRPALPAAWEQHD